MVRNAKAKTTRLAAVVIRNASGKKSPKREPLLSPASALFSYFEVLPLSLLLARVNASSAPAMLVVQNETSKENASQGCSKISLSEDRHAVKCCCFCSLAATQVLGITKRPWPDYMKGSHHHHNPGQRLDYRIPFFFRLIILSIASEVFSFSIPFFCVFFYSPPHFTFIPSALTIDGRLARPSCKVPPPLRPLAFA